MTEVIQNQNLGIKIHQLYNQDINNKLNIFRFKLPIKQLCNISVIIYLEILPTSYAGLMICSTRLLNKHYNDFQFNSLTLHEYSKEESERNFDVSYFTHIINKLESELKTITFNKKIGEFHQSVKEELENDIENDFLNLFKDFSNIKLDCDVCCVCYEQTHTKTKCNHSLCFLCSENIKLEPEDDDDECLILKCPICRQDSRIIN